MKQRLLFEGEVGDEKLEKVLPVLICSAIETNESIFLRWNGATVCIEPTDTIDTVMQKYEKEIKLIDLANSPRDGRDKHLYRIRNRISEFYIVAHSFDEAAMEMKNRLDRADYGFSSDRTVPSIDHLAVQSFFHDKQSFSDTDANLIIVE